jgi:CRP-like cAMP-binding protein
MKPLELLAATPGLEDFSDEELDLLDRVLVTRSHRPNELLIREGASSESIGASMFILLRGTVVVSTGRGEGLIELDRLEPGDVFGIMAMLDHAPRSADCRAVTPVVTAELTRLVFEELVGSHTRVAAKFQHLIARQLARDLRHLTRLVKTAEAGDDAQLRQRLGVSA